MRPATFTAVIAREGKIFVALCPELDVASQGSTRERAKSNLIEAVDLFLECADAREVRRRLKAGAFVTRFEASRA